MSTIQTTLNGEERRIALELWLEEHEMTKEGLATLMGVTAPFVNIMLVRDTLPAKRHRQLLALGLPENILPPPFTAPFGRPPKAGHKALASERA